MEEGDLGGSKEETTRTGRVISLSRNTGHWQSVFTDIYTCSQCVFQKEKLTSSHFLIQAYHLYLILVLSLPLMCIFHAGSGANELPID